MISQHDPFSLKRLVSLARRWLAFIVLTAIAASATVYLVSMRQPAEYQATTTLMIGVADQQPNQSGAVTAGQGLARTYARTFNNAQLYQQAVHDLNLGVSASKLQSLINVFAVRDTQLVEVQGTWSTTEGAIKIANHMAAMFARHRQEQALDSLKPTQDFVAEQRAQLAAALAAVPADKYEAPETIALRNELDNMIQRQQSLQLQTFDIRKQIDVISPASTAASIGLSPSTLALIALLVGGAVAFGLAILVELFSPTKLPFEMVRRLGLTSIVTLPVLPDPKAALWRALLDYSSSTTAQALRLLPAQLANGGKIAMVAGIGQRTDSASVATSFAAACAEDGRNVLLIDANVDAPRLETLLKVQSDNGLQQVLGNPALLGSALTATSFANVTLLSAKRAQNEAPVDARQFDQLIEQLTTQFDVIVIDLFEPLRHRIASRLIGHTDKLLLVAHEREISEVALLPYIDWSKQKMVNVMPTVVMFNGARQWDSSSSTPMPTPVLVQQS